MDDLERGERIRGCRESRRLTQPAVVELMRQEAGAHVVSLRGYQTWESGGGIKWENAKVLAAVLGADPEWIMSGQRPEETPSPFAGQDHTSELLARVENLLHQQNELLARQSRILERIEAAIAAGDGVATRLAETDDEFVARVARVAAEAFRPEPESPAPARSSRAKSRTRQD